MRNNMESNQLKKEKYGWITTIIKGKAERSRPKTPSSELLQSHWIVKKYNHIVKVFFNYFNFKYLELER